MSDNGHCLICGAHPCDPTKNHDLEAQMAAMVDAYGQDTMFAQASERLERSQRMGQPFRPDIDDDPDRLSGLGVRPAEELARQRRRARMDEEGVPWLEVTTASPFDQPHHPRPDHRGEE